MTRKETTVIKVGGSILNHESSYRTVARIFAEKIEEDSAWIVASAASGMTDALKQLKEDPDEEGATRLLRWQATLTGVPVSRFLLAELQAGIATANVGLPDTLLSWGERASVAALQAYLIRKGVDLPMVELLGESLPFRPRSAVVPGFYVRQGSGKVRCLPRGGSDISAVIVAAALGTSTVHLWKKGGGIRTKSGVLKEVKADALLRRLANTIKPLHPEAVRLAARCGIDLVLEDPFTTEPTTRVLAHRG